MTLPGLDARLGRREGREGDSAGEIDNDGNENHDNNYDTGGCGEGDPSTWNPLLSRCREECVACSYAVQWVAMEYETGNNRSETSLKSYCSSGSCNLW